MDYVSSERAFHFDTYWMHVMRLMISGGFSLGKYGKIICFPGGYGQIREILVAHVRPWPDWGLKG